MIIVIILSVLFLICMWGIYDIIRQINKIEDEINDFLNR